MATTRTRTILTGSTVAMLMGAGHAAAQDATIYYETPIIQSGQPVMNAPTMVKPVPVYTPVPVQAATPAYQGDYSNDTSYLSTPQVQTSAQNSGVSFVSGGIGGSEKTWFDSHAGEFGLKATYTDTTGHHLAGVNVTLTDASGAAVLKTMTEGPYLLVKAAPGTYSLTSDYEGQSKTQRVTVGKGLSRAVVTFNDINPDM